MATVIIDHKPVCRADKECSECGRIGCTGCICDSEHHPKHLIGKCIICAGLHKEENVTLYQPNREWDS
jgi:hypothetical protein